MSYTKNDDGTFSIKSKGNGKYVLALPDGHLVAKADKVDLWEKFEIKRVPGSEHGVTLWSLNTQKYVSIDEFKAMC